MAVALMILSAGSLLLAENRSVDSSAICGLMPLNMYKTQEIKKKARNERTAKEK